MNVNKVITPAVLPMVAEEQFTLFVNGKYSSDFLCTPEAIEELVTGNLYINGNISTVRDVEKIDVKGYKIEADISAGPARSEPSRGPSDFPDTEILKRLAQMMFQSAVIYRKQGGIHCSALSDGEGILAFKEDIGRHNAFDKVVGEALMKGLDLSSLIYFTSGRVNYEVMQKACTCGFSLIVSRSICSSSAFRLAEKNGMKLVGRILTPEPVVYRG